MRIAIGAPGNGALLKDALEERLVEDGRVSDVLDLSTPEITYPEVSFQVARAVAEGRSTEGFSSAAPVWERPSRPTRCPGCARRPRTTCSPCAARWRTTTPRSCAWDRTSSPPPAAWALIDIWLDLRHDPTSSYGPKVGEIAAYEARLHS